MSISFGGCSGLAQRESRLSSGAPVDLGSSPGEVPGAAYSQWLAVPAPRIPPIVHPCVHKYMHPSQRYYFWLLRISGVGVPPTFFWSPVLGALCPFGQRV